MYSFGGVEIAGRSLCKICIFQHVSVLHYILDNETNFVSVFVGLLIDMWKITKVVEVKLDRENLIGGFIPKLTYVDRPSYVQSSTKEYDRVSSLSICLSIYLFVYLSIYPSICLSIYLFVYLSFYFSIYLSICRLRY